MSEETVAAHRPHLEASSVVEVVVSILLREEGYFIPFSLSF